MQKRPGANLIQQDRYTCDEVTVAAKMTPTTIEPSRRGGTLFVVVRSGKGPPSLKPCLTRRAISIVLVWSGQGIVRFPVFEEPSVRGGRDETKTSENNNCNHNSHSERYHAAPLVLSVLRQHTGMTNHN